MEERKRPNPNRPTRTGADGARRRRPDGERRPDGARKKNPNGRPNPNGRKRPNPNGQRHTKKSRKRRKRNLALRVFLLFIIIVGAIGGFLFWKKYGPSKEKANLNEYYGITAENQLAVIVNNQVVGANGLMIDGTPYVEYAAVRDYINGRFYWDANENILLYTLPNEVVSVGVGSKDVSTSTGKQSKDYVILKTEGSTAYIALDFVKEYTDMDFNVYEKNGPNRVVVDTNWDSNIATVSGATQVRKLAGVKSPVLSEVKKKDTVTVIEKEGKWKKVRTADGYVGYMKANKLKKERKQEVDRAFEEPVFTNITKDYTINLGWHQVTSQAANSSVLQTIAGTKGLTTLSPTWFSVADNNGNITSIASSEYVNYAHQSGIEVWGLVDNFSENVNSFELLSHTSARENLINQLMAEALQTGLDGINVDFETISEETGEHYIQFIRELSVKCRQNGIVLSVDNYVPKGYNAHYHRKEQGIVADYVIIMGYDEHFSGSLESGSVASIDYVREGVEETLKEVPAEKVINAIPFYTRLWKEVPKTEEELAAQQGTEEGEYPMKVTSEALTMKQAENAVANAGVEATWDEQTKQNYAQWEKDGATYKIWLEDKASIEEKLKVMKEHNLAGTAAWKLGFENADIWELILKYVN